jgi:hypothetical protein
MFDKVQCLALFCKFNITCFASGINVLFCTAVSVSLHGEGELFSVGKDRYLFIELYMHSFEFFGNAAGYTHILV